MKVYVLFLGVGIARSSDMKVYFLGVGIVRLSNMKVYFRGGGWWWLEIVGSSVLKVYFWGVGVGPVRLSNMKVYFRFQGKVPLNPNHAEQDKL